MKLEIKPINGNVTPPVREALEKLRVAGGGELHFEKGEYHFTERVAGRNLWR